MGPTNEDVPPTVITAIRPGRIHIEKVNGPFVFEFKGSPPNTALVSSWRSKGLVDAGPIGHPR
jgi:hypothetical protein